MRRFFQVIAVVAGFGCSDPVQAADDPLAYIPANAAVFAHARAGDLWNTSLIQEICKAAGKDLDKYLGEAKDEIGLAVDSVDTVTFCYPNMPVGPFDQQVFLIIVTTKTPYDKDSLLKKLRRKDGAVMDNRVALQGGRWVLQFAGDTMFMVMHDSLLEKFGKASAPDSKPGVMTDALKLAREKNQFVASMDFSKLPNEVFTAPPPQLQPFLPLFKSKSTVLFGNVKDQQKEIKFGLSFVNEDATAAQDAEQSFKLLMKLAGNGLADIQKDKRLMNEVGSFLPAFKELERGVKAVKISRVGNRLDTAMTLGSNLPIGQMVADLFNKIGEEAQATNNLKQLVTAMHNYHDTNNGLPPVAICDKKGRPLLSWRVAILPFIEQNNLYNQFKLDEPWDSENNKLLIDKMPKAYLVPGAKSEGKTHYRVFHSNGAVFDMIQQRTLQSIPDGTSNTLMIVESADAVPWTKPDDIEFDPKASFEKLLRFTNDKTAVAFCDGYVRLLKRGLGDKTWRLLIQSDDGQLLPDLDK